MNVKAYICLSLFSVLIIFGSPVVAQAQELPVEVTSDAVEMPNDVGLAETVQSDGSAESSEEDISALPAEMEGDDSENAAMPSKEKLKKAKEMMSGKATKLPQGMDVDRMPSLFFTHYQYQAISSAKGKRGVVRAPTQAELAAINNGENLQLDPESRYIKLEGIVYKDRDDWTIWLNGKRVTPDAVPREVLDLVVYRDYIEVKWIDEQTNQIFPLRMKAHQRFNMDMRIFLPG